VNIKALAESYQVTSKRIYKRLRSLEDEVECGSRNSGYILIQIVKQNKTKQNKEREQ